MDSKLTIVLLLFLVAAAIDASPVDHKHGSSLSSIEKSSAARVISSGRRPWVQPKSYSFTAEDCRNRSYTCADCHTSLVCNPKSDGYYFLEATDCVGLTPYCNSATGSCVEKIPDDCGESEPFICMEKNVKIPDSDCRKFHYCDENYDSHIFECLYNDERFNPEAGKCDTNVECGGYDCTGRAGTKVPHSIYPKYYSYCQEGILVLDSCPGNFRLNVTSQECEAICEEEGIQPDATDCRYFYKCNRLYINEATSYLIRERKKCSEGEGFNPTEYQCTDANLFGCNIN